MKKIVKKISIISGGIFGIIILFFVALIIKMKYETGKMLPVKTQKTTEEIYSIQDEFANLFIIKNNDTYIAIDAGASSEHVKKELNKINIKPENVIAVILTHTDDDHIGALSLFKNAKVYISRAEEQMINGKTARFLFFKQNWDRKYEVINDKQIISFGGIKVQGILTPGHTPGAMCYLVNDFYLFTGDTIRLKDGKAYPFNEFFNMDTKTQKISLEKIMNLHDVKYVFTAHYGFTDNYQKLFKDWEK